jgi:tRNA modification GTPase
VVAARPGPTPSLAELDALRACRTALAAAVPAPTPETAALEIRAALGMLSQLDSPVASEDILDRVFSRFCVGK